MYVIFLSDKGPEKQIKTKFNKNWRQRKMVMAYVISSMVLSVAVSGVLVSKDHALR